MKAAALAAVVLAAIAARQPARRPAARPPGGTRSCGRFRTTRAPSRRGCCSATAFSTRARAATASRRCGRSSSRPARWCSVSGSDGSTSPRGSPPGATQLLQLTWDTNIGFVYDRATFKQLRTFTYRGEGWGLADDGSRLVMSDGTPTLRFLNPETLTELGRIRVLDGPMAVDDLNELEVVKGEIFANVWLTDRIAVIAPATGKVIAWLDLKGLMPAQADGNAVLNGIAYDAARDRLFVTGKLWPRMFEIRVVRRQS